MKPSYDEPVSFEEVKRSALANIEWLLPQWLPGGRWRRQEYVVRNPRRNDTRAGSFKINKATGKWADFATDDRGGDLISLNAYLSDISQRQSALAIKRLLANAGPTYSVV